MNRAPAVARSLPLPVACRENAAVYRVGRRAGVEAEAGILRSDALALSIKAARDRAVLPLARAAVAFIDAGTWKEYGYARIEDHARERFGRSGRWLRDLAALGRAIDSLPGLGAALTGEDGGRPLGRVAALLIGRVASAQTLPDWVRLARSVSVGALRAACREAKARGSDRPPVDGEQPLPSGSSDPALVDPALADPPSLIKLAAASPVVSAFDEALDLYRAVVGSEATVTSFVEALVGEARADPHLDDSDADATSSSPFPSLPSGVYAPPLAHGLFSAKREAIWARATSLWARLSLDADPGWAMALAGIDPSSLEAGSAAGTDEDAVLLGLLDIEDRLDRLLGRVLAEMAALGAWTRLGFDGLGHYAEQRLGMCRSTACERAAAARQTTKLPALFRAYQDATIGLDAALRIARLLKRRAVDDATLAAWIERARVATAKRLRDETRALGRDGVVGRRCADDAAPRPLDDDRWHRSLRRDPGRARGWVRTFGFGALASLEPDSFLSLRLPAELAREFLETIGSACRRLEARARAEAPDDTDPPSLKLARLMIERGRPVPGWVGLLAMLESFAEAWDPEKGAMPERPNQEVYIRAGWRCMAPGCTSRRNLEDHHIRYRSRQGSDDLSNRTCACRFHHQQGEHGMLARLRGTAPLGITWRLGRRGLSNVLYRNDIRLARS